MIIFNWVEMYSAFYPHKANICERNQQRISAHKLENIFVQSAFLQIPTLIDWIERERDFTKIQIKLCLTFSKSKSVSNISHYYDCLFCAFIIFF